MAKIVVVSSSFEEQRRLEEFLRTHDHEVVCFYSTMDLEGKIAGEAPDLVLMDVFLHEGNGFQICRDMKKKEQFREMRVILCGNHDDSSLNAWAKAQGAWGYLPKPRLSSELLTAIGLHLPSQTLARAEP